MRILFLSAVLLTLPGCISLPEYPKDWPPLQSVKAGECPAINGTFEDTPIAFSHGFETDGKSNSLSSYLVSKGDLKHLEVLERINVRLHEGRVNVAVYNRDEEVLSRILNTKPPCEQSLVKVLADGSFAMDPLSASVLASKEWRGLGLAADGSLILELHFSGGGTILLVPVAFVRRGWVRYRPSLPTSDGYEQGAPAQPVTAHDAQ